MLARDSFSILVVVAAVVGVRGETKTQTNPLGVAVCSR